MRDTKKNTLAPRDLLYGLINECEKCSKRFLSEVPMIASDDGALTDEQIEAVLVDLLDRHRTHG